MTSGLPHARGGVSYAHPNPTQNNPSSPRPWGCFCWLWLFDIQFVVFPTPVGVFLTKEAKRRFYGSLPHARGGVSKYLFQRDTFWRSSPRPWGCFPQRGRAQARLHVFPTPVGVFLYCLVTSVYHHRLPHARGGVSDRKRMVEFEQRSSPRPWGCF